MSNEGWAVILTLSSATTGLGDDCGSNDASSSTVGTATAAKVGEWFSDIDVLSVVTPAGRDDAGRGQRRTIGLAERDGLLLTGQQNRMEAMHPAGLRWAAGCIARDLDPLRRRGVHLLGE
ncbi:hypothetical protein A7E77_13435 [Sphingomonas sp. NIC1]|nr:hypothetical protein A7E77_13435 [Sphingomonas sp. NIC1]